MIDQLRKIIHSAYNNNVAFVVYRMPEDENITIQIQNDDSLHFTSNFEENGFIFAPFDNIDHTIIYRTKESSEHIIKFEKEHIQFQAIPLTIEINEKNNHIKLVEKTIKFINEGNAKKIVISRQHFIPLQIDNFEKKLISYVNLLNLYPEAYVYWWSHPKVGIWMGATPEKFISISNQSIVTMSLAGTQLFSYDIKWTEKEIDEQAIVTQFITKQLQDYCLNIKTSPTFTKQAGHLAHLCTTITGKLRKDFHLKSFIEKMHPTPAVCGNPKAIAKEFILENEGYDRKFYTGFLGKIDNYNNNIDLYVNLRCIEWNKTGVKLFVGGGITAGSIPEKEWEETVYKAQIMAKILG